MVGESAFAIASPLIALAILTGAFWSNAQKRSEGYDAEPHAALRRLVDDYEASGADWRHVERARFTANALVSAYKRMPESAEEALVEIDVETGDIKVIAQELDEDGNVVKPGYRQEKGVAPLSSTQTFVALRMHIDNFRWSGVPIYLRSGKRIGRRIFPLIAGIFIFAFVPSSETTSQVCTNSGSVMRSVCATCSAIVP